MVRNSTIAISLVLCIFLIIGGCDKQADRATTCLDGTAKFPTPQIDFSPERYICYKADTPPEIDGQINDRCWRDASWTAFFVDIEGDMKPAPRFRTRAKMAWDDLYFYIAADLEEPHAWATLTKRDAVIFHDNDFEVFIDPDGDTHEYYELEMNALNTIWDLLLVKPYRDGGPAVNAWDIQGLKTAVHVDGTLNDPSDLDQGWAVEIAIPWSVLKQCAHKNAPPSDGDQWRINYSRVEWTTDIVNGRYQKRHDPTTGKVLPENNWVWSPQGLINMHYPEMWGFVQFSEEPPGSAGTSFMWQMVEDAKWALRQVYYGEKNYLSRYGHYTKDATKLNVCHLKINGHTWPPEIHITPSLFDASVTLLDGSGKVSISQDGRAWTEIARHP